MSEGEANRAAAGAVRVEIDAGIAVITLDRPAKRNALNEAMLAGLRDACAALERRADARCAILTGVDRIFCAGGDIGAWGALAPREFAMRWVREGHAVFDALARLRQPLIAAINGDALGGGLELAACADLRVADADARFGQPEPSLGIVAGWSGTQRATRRFGARAVRRMALFGEVLDAESARALGVVDHVAPSGCALSTARAFAEAVAARAPAAIEIVKMSVNAAEGEERERALDALSGGWAASTEDLREGLAARAEKRPPSFSGS